MAGPRSTERRRISDTALVLEPSFLFRIPPRLAWPMVIALLVATALIEVFSSHAIWFGPLYLVGLALAAWALSARTGIALGLIVMGLKYLTGTAVNLPASHGDILANVIVKIVGIGIVIGFIGLARKSCEREWHSARTDTLTGVLNRQAFFEFMESRQCADGWSAIIYADLDGLKALNDEQGHAQGDRSLRAFVDNVRKTIRKGDILARMGGDEFVIFMKLTNEAAGAAVCDRLHRAINVEGADGAHVLKCSLGVLVLPDGSRSIDAELRAADQLMYMAKQSRCGAIVATAHERDGEILLSPSDSIREAFDLAAPVRQADRLAGSIDRVSEDVQPHAA